MHIAKNIFNEFLLEKKFFAFNFILDNIIYIRHPAVGFKVFKQYLCNGKAISVFCQKRKKQCFQKLKESLRIKGFLTLNVHLLMNYDFISDSQFMSKVFEKKNPFKPKVFL